jgi:UrcA family protein
MNTETNLRRRSTVETAVRKAVLIALCAIAPVAAMADEQAATASVTRTENVSLADLDLSTPEGVRAAHDRLHETARRLCSQVADTRTSRISRTTLRAWMKRWRMHYGNSTGQSSRPPRSRLGNFNCHSLLGAGGLQLIMAVWLQVALIWVRSICSGPFARICSRTLLALATNRQLGNGRNGPTAFGHAII